MFKKIIALCFMLACSSAFAICPPTGTGACDVAFDWSKVQLQTTVCQDQILTDPIDVLPVHLNETKIRMRVMMNQVGRFDPKVFPGQPNTGHVHTFMGGCGLNPYTTNIQDVTTSTYQGGALVKSVFWSPTPIIQYTGEMLKHSGTVIYYLGGSDINDLDLSNPNIFQHIPDGFFMITGSGAVDEISSQTEYATNCFPRAGSSDTGQYNIGKAIFPDCNEGDGISIKIPYPQCWDGVHLDSSDHKSHVHFKLTAAQRNALPADERLANFCPITHPIRIDSVIAINSWLLPPGYRGNIVKYESNVFPHMDYWAHYSNSPTQAITWKQVLDDCIINPGLSCGVGLLGLSGYKAKTDFFTVVQ